MNTATLATTPGVDFTYTGNVTTNGIDNTFSIAGANLCSDDEGLTIAGNFPANTQILAITSTTTGLATAISTANTTTGNLTLKARGPIDGTGRKGSSLGIYNWYQTITDNTLISVANSLSFRCDGTIFSYYRNDITWDGKGTGTGNKTGGVVNGNGREGASGATFQVYTDGQQAFQDPNITISYPAHRDLFQILEGRNVKFQNLQAYGAFTNLTFTDGAINNGSTTLTTAGSSRTDSCTTTSGSATITDASITANDSQSFRSVVGTGIPTAFTRTDTGCGTTISTNSVTDPFVVGGDQGTYRLVVHPNIPPNTFVGTVTASTSFLLSSSPTSQIDVLAIASGSSLIINLSTNAYVGTVTAGSPSTFKLSCVGAGQVNMLATATATNNLAISTTVPPWCSLATYNNIYNPFLPANTTISSITSDGHSLTLNNTPSSLLNANLTSLRCVITDVFGGGHGNTGYYSVQGEHVFNFLGTKFPEVSNCRVANSQSDAIQFTSWQTGGTVVRPTMYCLVLNCGITNNAQGAMLITSTMHIDVMGNCMWNNSSYHVDFEPSLLPGNFDINIADNWFGTKGPQSFSISGRGGAPLNSVVRIINNYGSLTPDGLQPLTILLGASPIANLGVIRSDFIISNNVDGVKDPNVDYPIALQQIDNVVISGNNLHYNTGSNSKVTNAANNNCGFSAANTAFITTATANFSFIPAWKGARLISPNQLKTTQILAVSNDGLSCTVRDNFSIASGDTFTVSYMPAAVGATGTLTNLIHDTSYTYTAS